MPGAVENDRVRRGFEPADSAAFPPPRQAGCAPGSRPVSVASGMTSLARGIWLFEGKKRARQRPAGLFATLPKERERRYAASGLENFSTVALTRALIGAIASLVTFTPISDSLELSATSESKADLA